MRYGYSLTMKYFFLLIEQLQSMARTLQKKPGQKLCSSCCKKTEKNKEASEADENNDVKEYLPSPNPKKL